MTTPRLLSDRYELGDTLGYGGMSEVHRGMDKRLGRDVAVKVLRADLARDPQFQMRFRREAQNAAALNHPEHGGLCFTEGDGLLAGVELPPGLASPGGLVYLNLAAQARCRLALGHQVIADLVEHAPGGLVVDPKLSL